MHLRFYGPVMNVRVCACFHIREFHSAWWAPACSERERETLAGYCGVMSSTSNTNVEREYVVLSWAPNNTNNTLMMFFEPTTTSDASHCNGFCCTILLDTDLDLLKCFNVFETPIVQFVKHMNQKTFCIRFEALYTKMNLSWSIITSETWKTMTIATRHFPSLLWFGGNYTYILVMVTCAHLLKLNTAR